jgi:CRISPR-associated protein (TIGR03984 family)
MPEARWNGKELEQKLEEDLMAGLGAVCAKHTLQTALLFFESGVVWARAEGDDLVFEKGGAPARMTLDSLLQGYCFSPALELRLWKEEGGLQCAWIAADEKAETITENYMLWGSQLQDLPGGFSKLMEGRRGIRQALPMQIGSGKRAVLKVTHVIGQDEDGQSHITHSKINALEEIAGGKNG